MQNILQEETLHREKITVEVRFRAVFNVAEAQAKPTVLPSFAMFARCSDSLKASSESQEAIDEMEEIFRDRIVVKVRDELFTMLQPTRVIIIDSSPDPLPVVPGVALPEAGVAPASSDRTPAQSLPTPPPPAPPSPTLSDGLVLTSEDLEAIDMAVHAALQRSTTVSQPSEAISASPHVTRRRRVAAPATPISPTVNQAQQTSRRAAQTAIRAPTRSPMMHSDGGATVMATAPMASQPVNSGASQRFITASGASSLPPPADASPATPRRTRGRTRRAQAGNNVATCAPQDSILPPPPYTPPEAVSPPSSQAAPIQVHHECLSSSRPETGHFNVDLVAALDLLRLDDEARLLILQCLMNGPGHGGHHWEEVLRHGGFSYDQIVTLLPLMGLEDSD